MCRDEFLHYLRVREWQDLAASCAAPLATSASTVVDRHRPTPDARPRSALLAGLLVAPRPARRRAAATTSARAARASCSRPGSVLATQARRAGSWSPSWSRPSRLFGRDRRPRSTRRRSSRSPAHLVTRTLQRAALGAQARRGRGVRAGHAVRAAARRRRAPCRLRPRSTRSTSRELFIRHALVEGDWDDPPPLLRATTRRCVAEVERARGARPPPRPARRRRGAATPSTTRGSRRTSSPARHFDRWWKKRAGATTRTC